MCFIAVSGDRDALRRGSKHERFAEITPHAERPARSGKTLDSYLVLGGQYTHDLAHRC
jgi:hypothetical protein